MIEAQRRLLADRIRNQAYAEAIRRAVVPKRSRVADLGTGTGFLAILCERAGAKSVWACDGDAGVIRLARQVAKDNRSRIRLVHGHSTQLAPPEPVDLVVSEVLGHFAGEEHLVESLGDARRWLAPGGRMIPLAVTQFLCPVTGGALQAGIDVMGGGQQGVDLAAVRSAVLQNGYVRTLAAGDLLDGGRAAQPIDRMRFPGDESSQRRCAATWTLPAGPVHGLCLWWEAELWEGVNLSTSPLAPPTHWEQIYLPLPEALAAKAGDRLECQLRFDTRWDAGCAVHWGGKLVRGGKAVQTFSMDNRVGFLP